ncbi:MAG TPA: adenylosuccinate lyase [Caulobacteraceae bacterium]|nr:adenylosuccinate lyase [Caulobacteraceae bacterium]
MIPRYTRPQAAKIWSAQSRYRVMFEIEAHAATAMAELGVIPRAAAAAIWERGGGAVFDHDRIDEIEKETRHDVLAFLTHVGEIVGPEARFLHQGMTSSDVNDTALAVQLARASDLLAEDLERVLAALKARAFEHKLTPTVGRSHGIHAEPTTFGLKLAGHWAEFARARERLAAARAEIAVAAISGPVGTFATVDPRVEAHVAEKLGLAIEPVSTQVIPRDRHAAFFAALAVIAASVERLAVEIRHLQRTEVGEAEEPFGEGQKGSSAMPHKRNPILSENLTGLARLVRSAVVPALEDVALWHERDISHSSVERGIAPDATVHLDFALDRLADLVERLVVHPERMAANLERLGGLVCSQRVLLALTQKGVAREAAYAAVQGAAHAALRGEGAFSQLLAADPTVARSLGRRELEALFDVGWYLRHVDDIFARVFGPGETAPAPSGAARARRAGTRRLARRAGRTRRR